MKNKFILLVLIVFILSAFSVQAKFAPEMSMPMAHLKVNYQGQELDFGEFAIATMDCSYKFEYETAVEDIKAQYYSIVAEGEAAGEFTQQNKTRLLMSSELYYYCKDHLQEYGIQHDCGILSDLAKREIPDYHKSILEMGKTTPDFLRNILITKGIVNTKITDNENQCYWTVDIYSSMWRFREGWYSSPMRHLYSRSSGIESGILIYMPEMNKKFDLVKVPAVSYYEIDLNADGSASIQEAVPFMKKSSTGVMLLILKILIYGLIAKLIVGFIFLLISRNLRAIVSVAFAGLVSLVFVSFLFIILFRNLYNLGLVFTLPIFPLLFMIVVDALIIRRMNRETMSMKRAFLLSTLVNIVSMAVIWLFIYLPSTARYMY